MKGLIPNTEILYASFDKDDVMTEVWTEKDRKLWLRKYKDGSLKQLRCIKGKFSRSFIRKWMVKNGCIPRYIGKPTV